MSSSAASMVASGFVLAAALLTTYLCRKRAWSRTLAIIVTIICFHATLIIVPPASALVADDNRIDWDMVSVNILGRIMFSVLLVSGAQGRWIWRAPRHPVAGPWDGNEDNIPD